MEDKMNSSQKSKWWLDAILFSGFLLTFFLDFTGLIVHQWLGMIAGALALVHLAMHWNWVKALTLKYWKFTNHRSQLYYLVDLTLFAGLLTIIGTGLVMSTWLNLTLVNYDDWHTVHVVSSLITLAMLIIKVGLHWRWIASALRSRTQKPAPALLLQPQAQTNGRREFLKVMGVTSVAAMFALGETLDSLRSSAAVSLDTTATSSVVSQAAATQPSYTITTNTPSASSTQTAATQVNTPAPTATATAVASNSSAAVSSTGSTTSICFVRCNRGCSYPGHCRKYTDANGNGKCDLGECA